LGHTSSRLGNPLRLIIRCHAGHAVDRGVDTEAGHRVAYAMSRRSESYTGRVTMTCVENHRDHDKAQLPGIHRVISLGADVHCDSVSEALELWPLQRSKSTSMAEVASTARAAINRVVFRSCLV
jgi:hypothetical protein